MTQHKNDEYEYEELTDLDLPLELTEEEREICKMIVDSAKPIKNYSLWKIKRSILFYLDKIIQLFNYVSDFVAKRQILSFILFFLLLMIIGFVFVLFFSI